MSAGIRRFVILSLIAALATFSGCGGGGSSSSDSGTTPGIALPARTLSWEPPTSYVDKSSMDPVTELDRFEIYVNESGSFADTDIPDGGRQRGKQVDPHPYHLLQPRQYRTSPVTVGPHYYVSLRAVALTGLKSDFSPTVSFSF